MRLRNSASSLSATVASNGRTTVLSDTVRCATSFMALLLFCLGERIRPVATILAVLAAEVLKIVWRFSEVQSEATGRIATRQPRAATDDGCDGFGAIWALGTERLQRSLADSRP